MNLIVKMKNTIVTVRPSTTRSLYNTFVDIHANSINSAVWHGTSHFLLVHRWFVWQFESALRYICRVYGASLNPPITDCCSIALPYWNAEVDYENNTKDAYVPQDHSAIFDTNYLGPLPVPPTSTTNYTVMGVVINPTNWPTVAALNNLPSPAQSPNKNLQPLTNNVKRWMNSTSAPFTIGPVWIINKLNTSAGFQAMASGIEAGPHSMVHIWISFYMQTMSSPDDPIFFLHHSNVERLLTLRQDCWDYELIPSSAITTQQYQALNPISTGGQLKTNPYNSSQPFDLGVDTPMLFWWKSYTSGSPPVQVNQDTVIFPQTEWPTPRNMHFIGNAAQTGWGGMYYVYGPDNIVSLMQQMTDSTTKFCPSNTQWRNVNAICGSGTKRDVSAQDKDRRSDNEKNSESGIKKKWDEIKNSPNAWAQMVNWECQSTPQVGLSPQFEDWISMTGLAPELFNRGCDNVSERLRQKYEDRGKTWQKAQRDNGHNGQGNKK